MDWDHIGIYHPDTKQTYEQYIEQNGEYHVWNEEEQAWETDSEYESDFDDLDDEFDESMAALQDRAEESIKLHKKPLDAVERKIRKENPDWPTWMARWWFYLITTDEVREKQILKLENDLRNRKRKKVREKQKKSL